MFLWSKYLSVSVLGCLEWLKGKFGAPFMVIFGNYNMLNFWVVAKCLSFSQRFFKTTQQVENAHIWDKRPIKEKANWKKKNSTKSTSSNWLNFGSAHHPWDDCIFSHICHTKSTIHAVKNMSYPVILWEGILSRLFFKGVFIRFDTCPAHHFLFSETPLAVFAEARGWPATEFICSGWRYTRRLRLEGFQAAKGPRPGPSKWCVFSGLNSAYRNLRCPAGT